MKYQLKSLLFDLDGVVFNTEPQYSVFWGGVCRQYHPEDPGLEHRIKGQTLVQIFDAHFAGMEEAQRDIVQRLNAFEAQMSYDYIPGFRELIEDAHRHGVTTALVTSSNQCKMDSVFRAHPEMHQLFDIVLTSEDFDESKPSPDCYLKAAARLGASNDECIVFEDSFNGLKSGMSADMTVVGLATTNPKNLIAEYCHFVIDDFQAVDYLACCDFLQKRLSKQL